MKRKYKRERKVILNQTALRSKEAHKTGALFHLETKGKNTKNRKRKCPVCFGKHSPDSSEECFLTQLRPKKLSKAMSSVSFQTLGDGTVVMQL